MDRTGYHAGSRVSFSHLCPRRPLLPCYPAALEITPHEVGYTCALVKTTVKEGERQAEHVAGVFGVEAEALVAEKGVGAVDLVPVEEGVGFVEGGEDLHAAFGGDVRVLAAPDHEELAVDVGEAGEGVVTGAAERGFVDVGGVEAGGGEDAGIEGGAQGEVAAHADAHGTDGAGGVWAGAEVVEDGGGVGVVGVDGLLVFELVAAVGAGLVVGEDGAGGLEFVVDLRARDDVAVAGEESGGAADGGGDLEDFRVEDDARVAAAVAGGAQDVSAHGAGGCGEVDWRIFDEGHGDMVRVQRGIDAICGGRGAGNAG